MTTSTMTLTKWYKGISVPRLSALNYRAFVASCVGIVNKIVEKEFDRAITVKFGDTPTAYADQDNALIVISSDFVMGDFTAASGGKFDQSEDVIPQILGVIVHEAAHFAFSPRDLTIIAKGVDAVLGRKANQNVVMKLGNVVEDIYIEYEVASRIPQIAWMLERLNDNLLSPADYAISVANMSAQVARPINAEELGQTVFHLINAKVHDSIPTTPYIDNLYALAQSARELHTIEERIALIAKLYELIMIDGGDEGEGESGEQQEADDGEEGGSDSLTNGDSNDEGTGGPPSLEGDEGDEAIEGMPKEPTADLGDSSAAPKEWATIDSEIINALIKRAIREIQSDDLYRSGDSTYTMNRVSPDMSHSEMDLDRRYAGLAKVGRQRAVTNRPYGIDQRRGHSIRKLHRIATDGRIFAEPMKSQTYKPMEVVLLVDCSGSMGWNDNITKAGEAVIGAAAGLKDARCEVEIVGHTADIDDITLTLYDIKEWSDPISVASRRMKRLTRGSGEFKLCQNRDHLAITEVAKDFRSSNQQRRRLLIVISDGEPAAREYYGPRAEEATKKAVDATRRMGIDVMSISITSEAMRSNDRIYGHQHNVCNEDPNVIEEIVRQLILS